MQKLNCSEATFQEQIDNLKHTRDIGIYLDALLMLQNKYLIILSTKDNPGRYISDENLKKIHKLGFDKLTRNLWHMYIGVSNKSNIIFNECGKKAEEPVEYCGNIDGQVLKIKSMSWRNGNISQILVNGIEYSLNNRGLNFVVFDFEIGKVIDSTTYDSHNAITTLYHRNLNIDEAYFDNHFFLPQKYQEWWRDTFRKSYFSNRKLNTTEVENGIIEPLKIINGVGHGGVCDSNFNFIAGHSSYCKDKLPPQRFVYDCYKVSEEELELSDETVVFGGVIYNHPGHLILDSIDERLWWLVENYDEQIKIAVVVTKSISNERANFIQEFIDVFGIPKDNLIVVENPTKFKKIIVPDPSEQSFRTNSFYEYTNENIYFFKEMLKRVKPSQYKKIYLTKSKSKRIKTLGEEYFIDFFKNKGFEIIDPEDYTIKEKAELMSGADEVVAMSGSNINFTVFCKPTTKVTELARVDSFVYADQVKTNAVSNISDMYVVNVGCGFLHKDFVFGLQFLSVTNDFARYAKEVYGEELDITPEEAFKKNVYEYLVSSIEYYSDPEKFNFIKNQKMITILQNLSEILLGKEFDTSRLDLTTNEDKLRGQVKQLAADLDSSKKRVSELENADIYKAAQLLETTNRKLEMQVAELHNAMQNMQNLQVKVDNLSEKNVELIRKNDELTNNNVQLTKNNNELTSKNAELTRKNDEITNKNAELIRKNDEITNKNTELTNKNADLTRKNDELINKNSELTLKNFDTEKSLIQTNHNFEIQSESYKHLQEERDNLLAQLKKIQSENTDLKSERFQLQEQIIDFQQSRSWKITKPLRSIAWFFRRIFGKNKY